MTYYHARSVARRTEGPAHKASLAPPPSSMPRSKGSFSAADSFVPMPKCRVASARVEVTASPPIARLPWRWAWPPTKAQWGFGSAFDSPSPCVAESPRSLKPATCCHHFGHAGNLQSQLEPRLRRSQSSAASWEFPHHC